MLVQRSYVLALFLVNTRSEERITILPRVSICILLGFHERLTFSI